MRMPKHIDQKQIERQWYIIKLLAQHLDGYSQTELTEMVKRAGYNATRSTIMSDIDDLTNAGFIYEDGSDARPVFKLFKDGIFNIHDLDLSIEELLGLYFLKEVVKPFSTSPVGENAYSVVNRIVDSMPGHDKKFIQQVASCFKVDLEDLSSDKTISRRVMDSIREAAYNHRTVRMKYYSFTSDEETLRELDPYVLFFKGRYYYVAGYCHKYNEIREFRIDRIKQLEILDKYFEVDPNFSYEAYNDCVWNVLKGDEHYTVEIRFANKGARLVREYESKRADKIIEQPDGSLIFIKTVSNLEEIARWILSYGKDARVIKPKELADSIKQQAQAVCEHYK